LHRIEKAYPKNCDFQFKLTKENPRMTKCILLSKISFVSLHEYVLGNEDEKEREKKDTPEIPEPYTPEPNAPTPEFPPNDPHHPNPPSSPPSSPPTRFILA
jgi:hypothetical protein